jgi:hypothetical protein
MASCGGHKMGFRIVNGFVNSTRPNHTDQANLDRIVNIPYMGLTCCNT